MRLPIYFHPLRVILVPLVGIGLFAATTSSALADVVDHAPVGTHRDVHQIVLRFSDDMAALGDDRAMDAATVHCTGFDAIPKGHWIDGKRWAMDFAKPLPDGIACDVTPNALRTLAGAPVQMPAAWKFDTGGPRLLEKYASGLQQGFAKEEPVVVLHASASVDPASLSNLRCEVDGKETPLSVLQEKEKEQALTKMSLPQAVTPDASWIAARCGAKPWPANAKINIVWGAKIASAAGVANEIDQNWDFQVRPAFTGRLSCVQLWGTPGCEPRQTNPHESHLSLHFSEDIPLTQAQKITLIGSSGAHYPSSPSYNWPKNDRSRDMNFSGNFAEEKSLTLSLPAKLVDMDGRALTNEATLTHTIAIAHLPAYLGMPKAEGIFPWMPGKTVNWPVATRNLEQEVPARAWHFPPATDTATLLQLQEFATRINDSKLTSQAFSQAYAVSEEILSRLQGTAPRPEKKLLKPTSKDANFTDLPLQGYGTWLVEADSPAYREVVNLQHQLLVKQGIISDDGSTSKTSKPTEGVPKTEKTGDSSMPAFTDSWANSRYAIVQLTNLHVESLISAYGESLLWVTAFDTGKPVADASVEIWNGGKIFSGKTDAKGRLPVPASVSLYSKSPTEKPSVVIVRHDDDVALTHVSHMGQYENDLSMPITHTILDRELLHPGETISMQHIARDLSAQGMRIPQLGSDWTINIYQDYCYDNAQPVYRQALRWSDNGSATSSWAIPKTAKLGRYCYQLNSADGKWRGSGEFQVEEFRTPSFDAALHISGDWKDGQQTLLLESHLSFMTSGPANGQNVSLKGRYDIDMGGPDGAYRFFRQAPIGTKAPLFSDTSVVIDASGQALTKLPAPKFAWPLMLDAQMSFSDSNGEVQSQTVRYKVWPQLHKFGIRFSPAKWDEQVSADVRGFDEKDHPLQKENVEIFLIDPQHHETLACSAITDSEGKASCKLSDKRLDELKGWSAEVRAKRSSGVALNIVGNIPGYNWNTDTQKAAFELADHDAPQIGASLRLRIRSPFLPATALVTLEREGILTHEVFDLNKDEEIVTLPTNAADAPSVQARLTLIRGADAHAANVQAATTQTSKDSGNLPWMQNSEVPVLFASTYGSINVNVHPAQTTILPGTKLPVKIAAKFDSDGKPAAHAHVTVVAVDDSLLALKPNETWSLLQAYWQQCEADTQSIGGSASLIYVPSDEERSKFIAQLEHFLDMQFGIDGMNDNELESFKRRFSYGPWRRNTFTNERIEITGSKIMRESAPAPAPTVAMYGVANGESLSGGTGAQFVLESATRMNFSTLALWKTDTVLDDNGEAEITIPFPDSLTRWRIAAIATSGADHFGTGDVTVITNQSVQILSGLPQIVRSDDAFTQKLTLRNTSDKPVHLTLHAEAIGERDTDLPGTRDPMPADALASRGMKFQREFELNAKENKIVEWPIAVPDGVTELTWKISARDASGRQLDALDVKQRVIAPIPVTVREATLLHIDHAQSLMVTQPSGAKPGRGGVVVKWKNSLVNAAMDGMKSWMEKYPYGCMEQLSSKAVVTGQPARWDQIVAKLPSMFDTNDLIRYFPETKGSEALTAYLLDIADAYDLVLPDSERMKTGLRRALQREISKDERQWMGAQGNLSRRLALQAAIAPNLANIKPTIPEDLHELPTIALLDWLRYVLASPNAAQRDLWLEAASTELRDRFDMQGTRLTLRHNAHDSWWWFMWNEEVANARAVLLVERYLKDEPRWHDLTAGMVASLVDRQHEGHWNTTVANAWAGAALREFAKQEEHGPVQGSASATFGGSKRVSTWPDPEPISLHWPQQGAREQLTLTHDGTGTPWATVQVLAAVDTTTAISHGLAVTRTIEPVQQKIAGHWSVGDVMRVKLTMTGASDLSWVAVRDSIPSGSTILGRGIGGESTLADTHRGLWWWRPSSAELGNESYRGYYEHIWSGTWEASYLLRLNNAGSFQLPPTHIEAMYAPEIFGEYPSSRLKVEP